MMDHIFCYIDYIIYWCNKNQGFLTLVLAFIALMTLIVTGILMRKSNKLSQENLSQAITLETQRLRPHIIVGIEYKDVRENVDVEIWQESPIYAHFFVKNIGLTPAYEVLIKSTPELLGVMEEEDEKRVSGLLNTKISIIAPGQVISDSLCSGVVFSKLYEEPKFEFNLKYNDIFGNDCGHNLILDLSYTNKIFSTLLSSSKGVSIEEKIHSALLNINMTLTSLSSNSNLVENPNDFQLSNDLQNLLLELVSAHNSMPVDQTNIFLVSSYIQNGKTNQFQIHHSGFQNGEYKVEFDKLLSLERSGFIARVSSDFPHESCSFTFYITPNGFKYNEDARNKAARKGEKRGQYP